MEFLKISKEGYSTAALCNLFLFSIICTAKKCLLMFRCLAPLSFHPPFSYILMRSPPSLLLPRLHNLNSLSLFS